VNVSSAALKGWNKNEGDTLRQMQHEMSPLLVLEEKKEVGI